MKYHDKFQKLRTIPSFLRDLPAWIRIGYKLWGIHTESWQPQTDISISIPSFDETLTHLVKDDTDLTRPELALLLPDYDFIDFAYWSDHKELIDKAKSLIKGDTQYVQMVKDGLFQRIWTWMQDYDRDTNILPPDGYRVRIGEIHCPPIPNCTATYSTENSAAIDVEIRGLGAGGGRRTQFTMTESLLTRASCIGINTRVDLSITKWTSKFSKPDRYLVTVLDIPGPLATEEIGDDEKHCGEPYDETKALYYKLKNKGLVKEGAKHDFIDVPMSSTPEVVKTDAWEISKDETYSSKIRLNIQTQEILGISVKSSFASNVRLEYVITGGHDYFGFRRSKGDYRRFWSWKPSA